MPFLLHQQVSPKSRVVREVTWREVTGELADLSPDLRKCQILSLWEKDAMVFYMFNISHLPNLF